MSTYLKNMAGYKHNQLKSKSYDEIQEMFDKEMKMVNTFVDMNTKLVKGSKTKAEGSSKRASDELEQEKAKKQKGYNDQEEAEMKRHIKIVKDDEVAIDAIPLATKPPVTVDYKIDKDGRMGYFKLIRVDGSSKRPEDDYERVLWGDLKVTFEPDIKSELMIELRADVELKDNIIVAMPKVIGEGYYIFNIHVEYEYKPHRCASCKVFVHIHEECLKNTSVGEKKTLEKPSKTSRSVPVGPKIGFKPQKEYRPVPKKPTASSSGNKKKGVVPSIEVSNSNPFEVLNPVDNDAELGTNKGLLIWKFEELLTSGKATLVDEAGNPLKKVEFLDDCDSEDEVALIDNDMACSMASERVGFGTQNLLEQWRDLYANGDYDEDPYDDDMYEEESDHVFGLANGTKSYPIGIVRDVEVHIRKLKLLNDFYVIDIKKYPRTPLLVGRGFLATANAVIDCKKAKIEVGEGITRSVFRIKESYLGEEEAPYWTTLVKRESYKPRPSSDAVRAQTHYYARNGFMNCHLPREWEIARDAEINPFKVVLVFRRMVEFLGALPINLKGNM
ncbi:RNA-directed DNA polymerase, eukaryota, reverse transcriptase zinc-binding domain protein [Tanacetum coccineum]